MSNRYSISPTLRLQIADSRQRRAGFAALTLFYLFTVYLALHRGYPESALLLACCGAITLPRVCRYRWAGAQLSWQRGIWTLERGGIARTVDVLPQSVALPWVIYLAVREHPQGRCEYLWLFNDTAAADEVRKLRVRLRLSAA